MPGKQHQLNQNLSQTPKTDNRWLDEAACRGLPPSVFYPDDFTMWAEAAVVKDLCSMCPVRSQCVDAAVTSPMEEDGWWGLPPDDIRTLRQLYKGSLVDLDPVIEEYAVTLASKDSIDINA